MITFLIPTFNEKKNIKILIDSINKLKLNFTYDFLFVDDKSNDGTNNELNDAKLKFNNVNYISRNEDNRDLTQSLVIAINKLKKKYTFILDCDLQHDYKKIQEFFDIITSEKIDVVIGSRFINNKQSIFLNKRRTFESKIAILICKLIGIKKITDPLSGFFLIKTDILSKTKNKITTRGFKILLTILYKNKNLITFKEVPIKFNKRKYEKSKLNLRVKLLFLEQILKLVFRI